MDDLPDELLALVVRHACATDASAHCTCVRLCRVATFLRKEAVRWAEEQSVALLVVRLESEADTDGLLRLFPRLLAPPTIRSCSFDAWVRLVQRLPRFVTINARAFRHTWCFSAAFMRIGAATEYLYVPVTDELGEWFSKVPYLPCPWDEVQLRMLVVHGVEGCRSEHVDAVVGALHRWVPKAAGFVIVRDASRLVDDPLPIGEG